MNFVGVFDVLLALSVRLRTSLRHVTILVQATNPIHASTKGSTPMKILIGTDGPGLDAHVARQFGKAAWYLIVDSETSDVLSIRHLLPGGHQHIVRAADEQGVSVVIVHDIGTQSFDAFASCTIMTASSKTVEARDALDMLMRGELKMLEAPTAVRSIGDPLIVPKRSSKESAGNTHRKGVVLVKGTPRGQHHLQQYGGRGH